MPPPDLPENSLSEKQNASPPIASPEVTPIDRLSTSTTSHAPSAESSPANHGSLERVPTAEDEHRPAAAVQLTTTTSTAGPVHSVFTKNQKRFIVVMASWAGFFSPVSANIYFPALNPLAHDLHVSSGKINLTLTTYMIFQGLAPAFIGDLADVAGRRPAYTVCFIFYIAANIGLALQDSYPALMVLRCLQSSGSSGTIALSSGVVSDVATAAERGSYMGFVTAGSLLGPAIGPVIGGILAQFLGWRAIFWFLVILAASFMIVFAIFFPETARTAVGNGSIAPKGWNMSLMNYLAVRKARQNTSANELGKSDTHETLPPKQPLRFPNPLSSIHIIADKENAALLFYNAFLFAVFYDITATIPSLYARIYGLNSLKIGLCYIPFGIGACGASLSNGQLLDRNFRRWARRTGLQIRQGRQQDLQAFPIEKARLQIAFPFLYSGAALTLVYGWVLDVHGPLAVLLVLLFFFGYSMTAAFNVISTLLVDFYPHSPATATAANNLVRCLLGAGATGVIVPMLDGMGIGWCYTALSLFLLVTSPMLWAVYARGMGWRAERRASDEARRKEREARRAGRAEEGRGGVDEKDGREEGLVGGGVMEAAAVEEKEKEEEDGLGEIPRRSDAVGGSSSRRKRGDGEMDLYRTYSGHSAF